MPKIDGEIVVWPSFNELPNFTGRLMFLQDSYRDSNRGLIKGFDTFPGTFGYHRSETVPPGICVVVEHREPFIRVLVDDKMLWFESYNLVEVYGYADL